MPPPSYNFIIHKCRVRMRRPHIIFPFFLLLLILVAFQQNYAATSSTFQETTTGRFKIATAGYDTRSVGANNSHKVKRSRKEAYEQMVRKTPSGPSPVGNNRPPSKA